MHLQDGTETGVQIDPSIFMNDQYLQ
jgi:hypothetical protein